MLPPTACSLPAHPHPHAHARAARCRESLGALAQAIKEFEGGVVMISHHSEFVGALAHEVWELKEGKLTCLEKKTPGPSDTDPDAADA